MEIGSTIVGTIIIIICIAPFVVMYHNQRKKEKIMLQSLNQIAQQHNCSISQHEFCGAFVLGIDNVRNFVFFLLQDKEVISQFVDLSEIQTCRAEKKARSSKNTMGELSLIERIELCFIPANKNKAEIKLPIFDEESNLKLSSELQFVDKWSKQINDRLKIKK